MNYRLKISLLVLLDSIIVSSAIFLAAWIVYPHYSIETNWILIFSLTSLALLAFHHVFAFVYKLYNKVWSYASVGELLAIFKAISLSIVGAGVVQFLINDFQLYKRALIVTWLLHIILIGGSRFFWRIMRDSIITDHNDKKRTLIVGAGAAGAMIARQLKNNPQNSDLFPVAFVDDDMAKHKMQLYNLPVAGCTKNIPKIVNDFRIEHIVIAIPSLSNRALSRLVAICNETDVKVQMIPKIEDIVSGKLSVSSLKNVDVEDVLGREPVELDINSISDYVSGRTVMVTGAGGSIGSEICRQLMCFSPGKILLVGHGEFSIYSIDMELRQQYELGETEIIPIIADIQDRKRIFEIVEEFQPEVIYHAAAHKHVPLMEYNPHEAVKNNVLGTKNVAEAANAFGVHTFVLVSTDKAVNPTNVMGATKRIAEMVIQSMAKKSRTKFVAVRFGNVLGSRGSVIPLFKKQIEKGGPVTVTHPEMTRYFMTIPEASRLVIQAGTLARGGEIFVLDMGEPVKIVNLARNLIKLSGYTEDEIPIEFTGIRPGEKMFEELLNEDEIFPDAIYEKIYIGKTVDVNEDRLVDLIQSFGRYNKQCLKEKLMDIVYEKKQEFVSAN